MIRYISTLLFACLFSLSYGQNGIDVHFTQNHLIPTNLNPALTGAFNGSIRVSGIYRDQWASILPDQFTSRVIAADVPLLTGFKQSDWIGVGINIIGVQAGIAKLTHSGLKASIAYHLALDEDGFSLLSVGIQGGFGQRRVKDKQALKFEDQILNNMSSEDLTRILEEGESFFDIGGGVAFSTVLSDNADFNLGIAAYNFLSPEISLVRSREELNLRLQGHAKLNLDVSEKITISPILYYQAQGGHSELIVQGMAGYYINPEKDITLNVGAGYRFGDAIQFMAGVDYGAFRVGAAYDLTNSMLNPTGSFELAASFIAKIYKKPNVKPAIMCPRL